MNYDYYKQKQEENKTEIATLTKQSNIMSFARLAIFILMVIGYSIAYFDKNYLFIILGVAAMIAFVLSVMWQNRIDWQLEVKNSIDSLCQQYLSRLNHTWQDLPNKGEQFKAEASFLNTDLDIIGNNSLFQYLSLAKSKNGQKRLFNLLSQPQEEVASIIKRQEAVSELANNQELHLVLASYINIYKADKSDLQLNDDQYLSKLEIIVYNILSKIYPIITIGVLIAAFTGVISLAYVGYIILLNIIILVFKKKRNSSFIAGVLDNHSNINIFIKVLEELEKHEYKSELLKETKDVLVGEYQASKGLQKLVKFQERIQSQSNILVYIIMDILLMWDYNNVVYYDQWKKTWGKNAQDYLEIFYDLETILSLGVIEQTHEKTCLPIIGEAKEPLLNFYNEYHPLLNKETVVSNDFNSKADSIIITGSNMSGKTTFIRGIGTNLILAYAGSSVCASKFEVNYMKIFTSIRVEDDFNQGVSTFYAEINRIKNMVEYAKLNKPMICFVDEIFKGTNSEDRIYGATKAIESLSQDHAINFVSTHDAQLTNIASTTNYHFAEYYENDEIKFDYKIKEGPCQTRNAKYLLKMAGIITE